MFGGEFDGWWLAKKIWAYSALCTFLVSVVLVASFDVAIAATEAKNERSGPQPRSKKNGIKEKAPAVTGGAPTSQQQPPSQATGKIAPAPVSGDCLRRANGSLGAGRREVYLPDSLLQEIQDGKKCFQVSGGTYTISESPKYGTTDGPEIEDSGMNIRVRLSKSDMACYSQRVTTPKLANAINGGQGGTSSTPEPSMITLGPPTDAASRSQGCQSSPESLCLLESPSYHLVAVTERDGSPMGIVSGNLPVDVLADSRLKRPPGNGGAPAAPRPGSSLAQRGYNSDNMWSVRLLVPLADLVFTDRSKVSQWLQEQCSENAVGPKRSATK